MIAVTSLPSSRANHSVGGCQCTPPPGVCQCACHRGGGDVCSISLSLWHPILPNLWCACVCGGQCCVVGGGMGWVGWMDGFVVCVHGGMACGGMRRTPVCFCVCARARTLTERGECVPASVRAARHAHGHTQTIACRAGVAPRMSCSPVLRHIPPHMRRRNPGSGAMLCSLALHNPLRVVKIVGVPPRQA